MNSSVLAYLENSAEYFPEKCAVTDEKVSYSYSELVKLSSSVGTQHGASAEQTSDHSFRTQSKGDCNF